MKFSLTSPGGGHVITSYSPDAVVVDGQTLRNSFIIAPDVLRADWRPKGFADLTHRDLQDLIELEPEVALLGTGGTQRFLETSMLAPFVDCGIGLEVMTTAAACRTYNIIGAEGRRVAAAILFF